jgi:hypothetical protein
MAAVMSIANAEQVVNVARALRTLRKRHRHDPKRMEALSKASMNLIACRWVYHGVALQIESASMNGDWYMVTVDGCPCKAGTAKRVCWHALALDLTQSMYGGDWQDDERGYFVADDGFMSRMESRLPRATPGELAADAMAEQAMDADMAALEAAVDEIV